MGELSISASVGLGLLIAVALWCQLHLACIFQASDKFSSLRGQRDREADFLQRHEPDYPACPDCMVVFKEQTHGAPCPDCGRPLLPFSQAFKVSEGRANVPF